MVQFGFGRSFASSVACQRRKPAEFFLGRRSRVLLADGGVDSGSQVAAIVSGIGGAVPSAARVRDAQSPFSRSRNFLSKVRCNFRGIFVIIFLARAGEESGDLDFRRPLLSLSRSVNGGPRLARVPPLPPSS